MQEFASGLLSGRLLGLDNHRLGSRDDLGNMGKTGPEEIPPGCRMRLKFIAQYIFFAHFFL
jgi:hypothetical protein